MHFANTIVFPSYFFNIQQIIINLLLLLTIYLLLLIILAVLSSNLFSLSRIRINALTPMTRKF